MPTYIRLIKYIESFQGNFFAKAKTEGASFDMMGSVK
jgi:hypothetical protein